MARYLYLLFLLLFPFGVRAQFSDSVHHMINVSSSGTFNRTADGLTYLLNNGVKYSVRKKSFVMNSTTAWIYGNTPDKLTNNDFNTTLDFNLYATFPHFYYWGLVNFTSSFSLKIKEQLQSGLGVAYRLIDREQMMFSISDGFLYERSNIIQEDQSELSYHTFRNSLRLQYRLKYKELLTFNSAGFYQPSLNYGGDFIITANASLGIKVWKWLSFTTTFTYNNVSRTRRENILFTYGLVAERFF
ncbi:DUF481 domain-containing protein [Taibaiella helva]|uniref:DUF481 domain-containing protein n=1 Tax=Taibaiella helva TaxID=2301235 RepID=UPI000E57C9A2|nr:DUF481 domain-containing protein [Taibaiella helva]